VHAQCTRYPCIYVLDNLCTYKSLLAYNSLVNLVYIIYIIYIYTWQANPPWTAHRKTLNFRPSHREIESKIHEKSSSKRRLYRRIALSRPPREVGHSKSQRDDGGMPSSMADCVGYSPWAAPLVPMGHVNNIFLTNSKKNLGKHALSTLHTDFSGVFTENKKEHADDYRFTTCVQSKKHDTRVEIAVHNSPTMRQHTTLSKIANAQRPNEYENAQL
jgi:hypothetical protein